MSGKSVARWEGVKAWAMMNPGKTAAIVTPHGTFKIVFEPKQEQLRGVDGGLVADVRG